MPRRAELFEQAGGSALEGYLLLKSGGGGNIPPRWIENARSSRKQREQSIATALREGDRGEIMSLRDWEVAHRKECFYRGIRILLELERRGSTML